MKILDVLLTIFVVLKMTDLIDWSWTIVLTPIWIIMGMYLLGVIFKIIGSNLSKR